MFYKYLGQDSNKTFLKTTMIMIIFDLKAVDPEMQLNILKIEKGAFKQNE